MAGYNALPLELLAEEFAKLPGIGLKTAQRLAYSIISRPEEDVERFANALLGRKTGHPLLSLLSESDGSGDVSHLCGR